MKRRDSDPYAYQSFAPAHPYVGWGPGQDPLAVATYSLCDWSHYKARREANATRPARADAVLTVSYHGWPPAASIASLRATPLLLACYGRSGRKGDIRRRIRSAAMHRRSPMYRTSPPKRRHASGPDPDDMPKGSRPFEWTPTGDWPYYAGQTE